MSTPGEGAGRPGSRGAATLTAIAVLILLLAPLLPGALDGEGTMALVGLPAESIAVVLALLIVLRRPLRALVAGAFAAVVVAAIFVAALDLGFRATLDRPFRVTEDGKALADAYGFVADATGPVGAASVVVLIGVAAVASAVGIAGAALRVARTTRDQGRRGRIGIGAVTTVWVALALSGAEIAPGVAVAASRSGEELVTSSARAFESIREMRDFDRVVQVDRLAALPSDGLLTGLAGKDVVIAFVESYGRVAVEPAPFTAEVRRALDDGSGILSRHGYSARSAFLTSPTFGGVSWLAHATLQSGVWTDSQQKYDRLLSQDRRTLTGLFDAAGWRTMSVVPSNRRPWPAGESFYGFDTLLDSRSMGYRGPSFGYARMPDQYTWSVFHERVAAGGPAPVMAEVDLVSSHTPWTPLPRMVPWDRVGDGSVFDPQPADGQSRADAWADPARVRELYGESIAYALDATFSALAEFDGRDLVLVIVGDHQPWQIVSGEDADHDVPITIIAKDPAVLRALAPWGWDHAAAPTPGAPVWRMDVFRDRFVRAFSG